MRTLFALVLLALLLGVGIVAIIETDPGYILISHGKYSLETSLWVGLVLIFVFVLLVYYALRLVFQLVAGQRSLVNWFGNRQSHHALRLSTRGVISYVEGNWAGARRQLLRGAQRNEAPLVNYLLAARASDKLQEPERVQEYLSAASESESGAALAAQITLAEIKLEAGEHQQAVAALEKHRNNASRRPYVLSLLYRAYQGLQDWDKVLELLPDLRKYKLLDTKALEQLERDVHCRRLEDSVVEHGSGTEVLTAIWQKVPAGLRHDPAILDTYVRRLLEAGANEVAEKTILRAQKRDWVPSLVRRYGLIEGEGTSQRLAQAERWLKDHPDDVELLLCLGRLSARDKLWGKARDYFESSYQRECRAETCAELGRLLTSLGEPKVAAAYFREGLLLSADDLPELPMPDLRVVQG